VHEEGLMFSETQSSDLDTRPQFELLYTLYTHRPEYEWGYYRVCCVLCYNYLYPKHTQVD